MGRRGRAMPWSALVAKPTLGRARALSCACRICAIETLLPAEHQVESWTKPKKASGWRKAARHAETVAGKRQAYGAAPQGVREHVPSVLDSPWYQVKPVIAMGPTV